MTILTPRCIGLLEFLDSARWLSTSQIQAGFFPNCSLDFVRKRLRKLVTAGFLFRVQPHPMAEAFFTLGREGKRALEERGSLELALERKLPKQLEHLCGINDIRVSLQQSGWPLAYAFSCWELTAQHWQQPVIPDVLFAVSDPARAYAVEYDRGQENAAYFLRTKITVYDRGLDGLPLTGLIVITDSVARQAALARAIGPQRLRVLYTTRDLVREAGLTGAIYSERPGERPTTLY